MKGPVRPIALAVIKREHARLNSTEAPAFQKSDAILVFKGRDPHTNRTFYRPLGGTIEFGERGEQTVRRELYEETGLELANVQYLATIENIFVCGDQIGHEIVLVFHARLADASSQAYDHKEIQCVEANGQPFTARWMPLHRFDAGGPILVPTGLLDLLVGET